MRKHGQIPTYNRTIEEYKCDRCGRVATGDDIIEYQEFITIHIEGGYGSVFGDGEEVECDLCQHCVKLLVGNYLYDAE